MINDDKQITLIGEMFGIEVAELVRGARAFTVSILEVDDNNAYVTMMGTGEDMPVPLTGMSIANTMFKIKPNVGSLSIVMLANGMDGSPFFVAHSEIDSFVFARGTTEVKWEITPTGRDEDGDEIEGETNDVLNLTIGDSKLKVNKDVWEFNGGTLGGLTKTQELKTQLDKSNTLIESLLAVINGTEIPEPGNGSPSALQIALSAAITGQSLGEYSDIENEKITQ